MKTMIVRCECADARRHNAGSWEEASALLAPCADALLHVDDLCGLAALKPEALATLTQAERVIVIACRPRAVRGLLQWAADGLDLNRVEVVDCRAPNAAEALKPLLAGADVISAHAEHTALDGDWRPWYPIIDRERCVDCGACLDFCLFGVYERDDEGHVTVKNPTHCKYSCPACSRVCPKLAVMFPKYDELPYDGAEPVDADATARAEALSADDLYDLLKSRQKERKRRLVKQEVWDQALKERTDCKRQHEP